MSEEAKKETGEKKSESVKKEKPKHEPGKKDDICPRCGGDLTGHDYYGGDDFGCQPGIDYNVYCC